MTYTIRKSTPEDQDEILAMYPIIFPDEDLCPLLQRLFQAKKDVFSYVAISNDKILGHVIFTRCGIEEQIHKIALLGPLAVSPTMQRQGIGKALVRYGFKEMSKHGMYKICVLGDPTYYKQFDFVQEDGIIPPYPIPDEWKVGWQSIDRNGKKNLLSGKILVPQAWQDTSLWSLS